jgi:hypothetical protein
LIHKHDILAVLWGGADQWNAFRRRHTESIGQRLPTQAAQAAVKRKTAILAVPRRLFLRFSGVSFIASTPRASSAHRINRLLQQNRPLANVPSRLEGFGKACATILF